MRVTGRTTDMFLCKNADPRHGSRPRGLVSHCAPVDRHCLQKSTWTRCPEHPCMQLTSEIAPSWSGQRPFVFQTIYPSKAPRIFSADRAPKAHLSSRCWAHWKPKANLRTSFFISFRLVLFFDELRRESFQKFDMYMVLLMITRARSKLDTSQNTSIET